MASRSPQLPDRINYNMQPISPRSSSGPQRPSLMKRHSSQSQVQYSSRAIGKSPGSEYEVQPLRHAVRGKGHARVVLPRNHSSGRNLAKLARQTAAEHESAARPSKNHARQRSHEGDTEIRLPGSLDESEPRPPPMRRNLTAYNLPRNASNAKLKKNLSHGQLQRLQYGKDLAPLTTANSTRQKAPLSPGLKGKSKRPKSVDWNMEKDLHEQEVELAMQQQEKRDAARKVGFAVGVDNDDADQVQNMEGSGLDEGEWTEESASVSPYSTRQNTANNSRRPSVLHDKSPDKSVLSTSLRKNDQSASQQDAAKRESESEEAETETETEAEADGTPANSFGNGSKLAPQSSEETAVEEQVPPVRSQVSVQRSPLHAAKEHPNPTAQLLRRNSNQLPAPALLSNISAMDRDVSSRGSPANSIQSANVTGEHETDELVSRFVPSTSNGSGTTTGMQNTPKSASFTTPDDDYNPQRDRPGFSLGPVSPGSTVSGSSGAATPALGRSRIELRMLQEKAIADMESAAEKGPIIPAHVYDRRNESLKSYRQLSQLSQQSSGLPTPNTLISLGPEIFQGRFKAVNTELKVVQKFRNPIAESIDRLQTLRGSKKLTAILPQEKAAGIRTSKSAVTLPTRTAPAALRKENSGLSTSTSPPASVAGDVSSVGKPALMSSKSAMAIKPMAARRAATRGVSFAGMDEQRVMERTNDEPSLDDIVKDLWDSVLTA